MTLFYRNGQPALLLGIADFVESSGAPFPIGSLDLFRLSQHKPHIIYPGIIHTNVWLVLVDVEFIKSNDTSKWELRIADQNDEHFATINLSLVPPDIGGASAPKEASQATKCGIVEDCQFAAIYFTVDNVVKRPGRYTVYFNHDGNAVSVGSVHFHYQKALTLMPSAKKVSGTFSRQALEARCGTVKAGP